MKEFTLYWDDFRIRYLKTNTIFVDEKEDKWMFYTTEGNLLLKTEYNKSQDYEKNAIFVLTYLNNQNIIKIIPEEEIIEPEDVSNGTDTELQNPDSN